MLGSRPALPADSILSYGEWDAGEPLGPLSQPTVLAIAFIPLGSGSELVPRSAAEIQPSQLQNRTGRAHVLSEIANLLSPVPGAPCSTIGVRCL